MKRLHAIVVIIQVVGGILFFAALFGSPIPAATKLLLGVALIFVSSSCYLIIVHYLMLADLQRRVLIEIADKGRNSSHSVDQMAPRASDFTIRSPEKLGYMLVWMFVLWIFGGWVLNSWNV